MLLVAAEETAQMLPVLGVLEMLWSVYDARYYDM